MLATRDEPPLAPPGPGEALSRELRELAGEGIVAVHEGDFEAGYRLLGEVCDRLRAAGERLPAWIVSFYGLALAMHRGRHRDALALCQAAVEAEPMQAEYYANLAEAYVVARQLRKAVDALRRGLGVDASNPRLLDLQRRLGARRVPVIRRLDRSHPLNVTLGRIRHAVAGPVKLAPVSKTGGKR